MFTALVRTDKHTVKSIAYSFSLLFLVFLLLTTYLLLTYSYSLHTAVVLSIFYCSDGFLVLV